MFKIKPSVDNICDEYEVIDPDIDLEIEEDDLFENEEAIADPSYDEYEDVHGW